METGRLTGPRGHQPGENHSCTAPPPRPRSLLSTPYSHSSAWSRGCVGRWWWAAPLGGHLPPDGLPGGRSPQVRRGRCCFRREEVRTDPCKHLITRLNTLEQEEAKAWFRVPWVGTQENPGQRCVSEASGRDLVEGGAGVPRLGSCWWEGGCPWAGDAQSPPELSAVPALPEAHNYGESGAPNRCSK